MKSEKKNILLGIETGIGGGSVSVFRNEKQIGFWTGNRQVSKSEDVLQAISDLFELYQIKRNQIARIYISNGAGSYTGLRIGKAIALGLTNALPADYSETSVLEAMRILTLQKENSVVAVPVGRNNVLWTKENIYQPNGGEKSSICESTGTIADFLDFADENSHAEFILHHQLFDLVKERGFTNVINAGENLAFLIISKELVKRYASDNEESKPR